MSNTSSSGIEQAQQPKQDERPAEQPAEAERSAGRTGQPEQPTAQAGQTVPPVAPAEPVEQPATAIEYPDKAEGPIAAAIIAGGVGATALGLFTTLAAAREDVSEWLDVNSDVGPLSGKTILAVAAWLVAWAVLHIALRGRPYETRRAFVVSMVLVGLGVVGTFPTFFQAFD